MKKLAILLSATSILALSHAPAIARSTARWQPYFGLGYQGVSLTGVPGASSLPNSLPDGVNAHIGTRRGHFGIELGYSRSEGKRELTDISGGNYTTKMAVYGPSLDGAIYLPIGGDQLSAVGTLGITYMTGHGSSSLSSAPFNISKTQIGGRAGGGLQWRPMQGFSIDAIARYQTGSINGLSNGGMSATVGFNFYL